jgi:hypothetical protein
MVPFEAKLREVWALVIKQPFISGAIVLLFIAVGLALANRVAAASLIAGLFVVLALFHYLPQMESFKAYGIEARWRARLNEADDILRKLRQSALASARLTYHTLGWGSRMGGQRGKMKQALADEMDKVLSDLGFDEEQLQELRRDYLYFATYDAFNTYDTIVGLNISTNVDRMTRRLNELSNNQDIPEARELTGRLQQLRQPRPQPDLMVDLRTRDFREYCHSRIPKSGLPEKDAAALNNFAERVADMIETCKKTGRVTDDAVALIESYGREERKTLYRSLFNDEPLG